jgi:hypothetical protein
MTLDQAIAEHRDQATAAFYMGDYETAAHLARIADWLEELGKARAVIEQLKQDLEDVKF